MPASGFTGTVASITVNMTGTGSVTGKEVSGTTTISVPVSQPDRFEVGQLELSGDTIWVRAATSTSATWPPAPRAAWTLTSPPMPRARSAASSR